MYINIGIYTYYKCVKNNCLLFCLFFLLLGVMPLEHFTALCKDLENKSATAFLMLHDIL